MRLVAVLCAAVATLLGCSTDEDEGRPTFGALVGNTTYPWFSATESGGEGPVLLELTINLDDCSLGTAQGGVRVDDTLITGLHTNTAVCNAAELAEGRTLLTRENVTAYQGATATVEDLRRIRVEILWPNTDDPESLSFFTDPEAGWAADFVTYFHTMVERYAVSSDAGAPGDAMPRVSVDGG